MQQVARWPDCAGAMLLLDRGDGAVELAAFVCHVAKITEHLF